MTAAEFAFLALGLILGVAVGAAVVEFLRARPPAPREVRVTVAQDAIPRRAATLSDDAFAATAAKASPGGPVDRPARGAAQPPDVPDPRTTVPSPVGIPVRGETDPMLQALRASAAASAVAAMRATGGSAPAGAVASRPTALAVSGGQSAGTPRAGAAEGAGPAMRETSASGGGGPDATTGVPVQPGVPVPPGAAARPVDGAAPSGPCEDARRLADERCQLADRARAQAVAAEETHRAAQRSYDDHEARADQAAVTADPRAIRHAKDEAQARFRSRRGAALTTEEVEAAARDWLAEINRINAESRDAAATLTREREAVRVLTLELERLAVEADAARIAAETAAAACLAARESLAACEEQAANPTAAVQPAPPGRTGQPEPPGEAGTGDEGEPLAAALGRGAAPRIFRLLRGDRSAMVELVAALAGDDPGERKRWQLLLSDLVDAILADSIAASALSFPADHPFWGPFTVAQDRDIASALSSLGYRFDGLGGWADGRIPSQRDLSLAVGYAGLDPMRIRHWPPEAEMADLYRDVVVAADEHLALAAGDLTLGGLVTMLGRRADGLAELWNHWGRIRPLLLEEG